MKSLRIIAVASAAFFIVCMPAFAQLQTPDHSVPIGRGSGTGFKFASPSTAGYALFSNGASSDPTFQAITNDKLANAAATTLKGNPTGSPAAVQDLTLGTTLNFSGTTVNCTTTTASQIGCSKPDGTTIAVTAGVLTAIGAAATSVGIGTTTVATGNNGYSLYSSAGTLGNQLVTTGGGFVNKIRNGTMDIWQRGTSAITVTTSGAYTADGWIVVPTGASLTVAPAPAPGNLASIRSLGITGAASVTGVVAHQRIESFVVAPLAGQTATVQFQYFQDSGGAVTPKISTCYASASDNFSTCTADLASTSVTSCANNMWCTESYTFAVSANAANGYQLTIDCNYAVNTTGKHCYIGEVDLRATPGVTTGVNTLPPTPELRPVHSEMAFCQRYYEVLGIKVGGTAVSTTDIAVFSGFAVTKRSVPVLALLTTTPTIVQFGVAPATGSGSANASSNSGIDGFSMEINGFTGLSANFTAFSTTQSLISASSEL